MNFRSLLALIAGVILFSGVASAQDKTKQEIIDEVKTQSHTVDNSKICQIKIVDLEAQYHIKPQAEPYNYSEIIDKINSGTFDEKVSSQYYIKQTKKMCLLLFMLANSKADTKNNTDLAGAIVDRYGPFGGQIINRKRDVDIFVGLLQQTDRISKIYNLLNSGFHLATSRITTNGLPKMYKDDDNSVNIQNADEGRARLIFDLSSTDMTTYVNTTHTFKTTDVTKETPNPDKDKDKDKAFKFSDISQEHMDQLHDGWFRNWAYCDNSNNIPSCRQALLEGYDPINLYNLPNLKNNVPGSLNVIINQLDDFIGIRWMVANNFLNYNWAQEDLKKLANCPDSDKSADCIKKRDAQSKISDNVTRAKNYVKLMNDFLLNEFSTDSLKNICFGFMLNSASDPFGSYISKNITSLDIKLSAEKTMELFDKVKTANSFFGNNKIQKACVLFNRIKKAEIADDKYQDFANKIIDAFGGVDAKKTILVSGGISKVDILLGDAIKKGNDHDILYYLSLLKGFNIFDNDYYKDSPKKDSPDFRYDWNSAVEEVIIEHSRAGKSTEPQPEVKKPETGKSTEPQPEVKKPEAGTGTGTEPGSGTSSGTVAGTNPKVVPSVKPFGTNKSVKTAPIDFTNRNAFDKASAAEAAAYKKSQDDEKQALVAWANLGNVIKDYINGKDEALKTAEDMINNTDSIRGVKTLGNFIVAALGDATSMDPNNVEKLKKLLNNIKVDVNDKGKFVVECDPCFADLMKSLADTEIPVKFDISRKDYNQTIDGYTKLVRASHCFDELAKLIKEAKKKEDVVTKKRELTKITADEQTYYKKKTKRTKATAAATKTTTGKAPVRS